MPYAFLLKALHVVQVPEVGQCGMHILSRIARQNRGAKLKTIFSAGCTVFACPGVDSAFTKVTPSKRLLPQRELVAGLTAIVK